MRCPREFYPPRWTPQVVWRLAVAVCVTAVGLSAGRPARVEAADTVAAVPSVAADKPVSFANDVMPILTKAGCNIGVCHAKAGGGQNGFQLSLLGFEPLDDYEHLTQSDRGRRLSPHAPEASLLLRKGAGLVPHGGGVRLKTDSAEFATLARWIQQGALADVTTAPQLTAFEIEPRRMVVPRNGTQQLTARATYADGMVRDVTSLALFESNDSAMAEVSPQGLVRFTTSPARSR